MKTINETTKFEIANATAIEIAEFMFRTKLSNDQMLRGYVHFSKLMGKVDGGMQSEIARKLKVKVLGQILKEEDFQLYEIKDDAFALTETINLKRSENGSFRTISTFTLVSQTGTNVEINEFSVTEAEKIEDIRSLASNDIELKAFQFRDGISDALPSFFDVYASRESVFEFIWAKREMICGTVEFILSSNLPASEQIKFLKASRTKFKTAITKWNHLGSSEQKAVV